MARSLLPSRWRSASHAKALAKRANRREVARALAALEEDPEAWEDEVGLFATSDRAVRQVVERRRSSDKVNPFIRWATATTREVPKAARLGVLRGVVPKGLIGEHALTHLARLEAFDARPRRRWRRLPRLLDRGEVVRVLRRLVELRGGHALVNDVVARHAVVDEQGEPVARGPGRRLLGVHDVGAFVDGLGRVERYVVDALCRAVWEARFDLEEAGRVMPSPVVVPVLDFQVAVTSTPTSRVRGRVP
ncbi:MAG: hypothetical protein JNJ54_31200 [Myxococcaceae bacterium]|nr:hypothetical protein [Myxococcaceae bacterium]